MKTLPIISIIFLLLLLGGTTFYYLKSSQSMAISKPIQEPVIDIQISYEYGKTKLALDLGNGQYVTSINVKVYVQLNYIGTPLDGNVSAGTVTVWIEGFDINNRYQRLQHDQYSYVTNPYSFTPGQSILIFDKTYTEQEIVNAINALALKYPVNFKVVVSGLSINLAFQDKAGNTVVYSKQQGTDAVDVIKIYGQV